MKKVWKFNSEEKKIIRDAALSCICDLRCKLEAGVRLSLIDSQLPMSNNCMLVDKDPNLGDSDLYSPEDWKTTCKGVELTEDGKAYIDFYVYGVGEYGELITNIGVYYADGAIQKIDQIGKIIYRKVQA